MRKRIYRQRTKYLLFHWPGNISRGLLFFLKYIEIPFTQSSGTCVLCFRHRQTFSVPDRSCRNPEIVFFPNFSPNHVCVLKNLSEILKFVVICYWNWIWRFADIFVCKVNIWNATCALATTFIFNLQMDVLVKVSKLLRHKISRPEGDLNTQPSDSCQML